MNRLGAIAFLLAAAWSAAPAGPETGFSTGNASALLRTLSVEIGPRPMGSPAERRALAFAERKLREYGCDTTWVIPMTQTSAVNTSSGITVGVLRGKTGRIIVLGGHIDSAGPEIPGANDDGSGSAVVLEAARVLGSGDHESTIVFALFGGEEQGLEGSEYFVTHFDQLDSVALMLQVDMANGLGTLLVDPNAHGATAPAWLLRAAVEEFDALGYTGLTYATHYAASNYSLPQGSGSDHEPFLRAGIPAIDFTTDIGDPIHTQQDTYQNFDVEGLKRSGDLVLALIRRFDGGTPDRTTGDYWLSLAFGVPIVVPIPLVWAFVLLAPALGVAVLFRLRKGFLRIRAMEGFVNRRWTTTKVWLVALLAATAGWMSIDAIGLLKGVRFPWYAHPGAYYVPALLATAFALLAGVRLAAKLSLSVHPYVLFKRSVIILTLLTALAAWGGVKLAVAPAMCLALLSVALLLPGPLGAALSAALAPIWLFRLVFSEADELLFRFVAPLLPGSFVLTAGMNAVWVLLFSLLLLAWIPGVVAVVRRRANPWTFIAAMKARRLMVMTAGLFGISVLALWLLPAYERPWYPNMTIEEVDMPGTDRDTMRVVSSEWLDGAAVDAVGLDTVMEGRALRLVAPGAYPDSGRWLTVGRGMTRTEADTATLFDVTLSLSTPIPPYTVTVSYTHAKGGAPPISTTLRTQTRGRATRLSWYSFPDTPVSAAVRFAVGPGDTLLEEITVTFDTLLSPVGVRYRESNRAMRSIVREMREYRGPPAASPPDSVSMKPDAASRASAATRPPGG